MTPDLDIARPWGATHHWSDLTGPVHWIHWAGPADAGDREPYVLVHGLGGSHANWLDVGRIWSLEREVFALDLRGFGLTPGYPADTRVLANRDLVVTFIEQVVRRRAVVMGNSMGGMIATFVARGRPDLVSRLVLIDPALTPPLGVRPDPVVAARFALFAVPGLAERAMRRVRERTSADDLVRDLAGIVFADASRASQDVHRASVAVAERRAADPGIGDIERSFTAAARSLLRIMAQRSRYAAHLARLPVPVLLLQGDADRLVDVRAARVAARANPQWSFVELEGVGHAPQMEVPQTTAALVDDWLAGAASAA